jgi:hypothetical protein
MSAQFRKEAGMISKCADQAGPKIAAFLCVVDTCRRLKAPVREDLAAVLPGLGNLPITRIPRLAPDAWAARQGDA